MSVVDGAAYTQEDEVESNGCSLENVAKVFICAVPLRRLAGSEVWCLHNT